MDSELRNRAPRGARRRAQNRPVNSLERKGQPPQIISPIATNRGAEAKRQITETHAVVSARAAFTPDRVPLSLCTVMRDMTDSSKRRLIRITFSSVTLRRARSQGSRLSSAFTDGL